MVNYFYLADGTKTCALDTSGTGLVYRGAIGDGFGIAVDAVAALVPFLPGGVGALRTGAKVVDAVDAIDNVSDVFKNRVKLRKETKEIIKNKAPKNTSGQFIDPNTMRPIEHGQEVFGHKRGKEYKNDPENQNKTRREVIEEQNNPEIYQIEDKKSNASHKYEEK